MVVYGTSSVLIFSSQLAEEILGLRSRAINAKAALASSLGEMTRLGGREDLF